jgi:hypothetical protein
MSLFRTALTNLANLSVTGVANNYDVDQVPDDLSRAQLPALLVMPIDLQDDRLFKERGEGFQAVAFSSGARTVTYTTTHLLLVAPVSAGKGIRSHLPTLIDLIDNYFAALAADVTLAGALLEPARVKVEPGIFTHGDTDYHACAFRHTWFIKV